MHNIYESKYAAKADLSSSLDLRGMLFMGDICYNLHQSKKNLRS